MPVQREDSDAEGQLGTAGAWAQGLSKGVYVHRGVARRGRKRPASRSPARGRKAARRGDAQDAGRRRDLLAACLASRSTVRVEERVESYTDIVEQVEASVRSLQEEVYTGVFDSIVTFVRNAGREAAGPTIPTAVLLTGVNMPDHVSLFSLLTAKLEAVTPHTSLVGPGLSLRALVTQVVMDLATEDGAEERTAVRRADASMATLSSWYLARYPDPAGPRPPLVVILQQFEGTAGPALQDLIALAARRQELPLVLVLGVATTVATVHRSLAQAATASLTIHTFGSPPAALSLDQVVEKVIVNPDMPFKLDYRVFQFLIENFLYHDFAIRHFIEGFKFILGEHFYRSPASLLCCPPEVQARRLAALAPRELDCLLRLPSMRAHIETLPLEQQAELLTCPAAGRRAISALLAELQQQVQRFTCLARGLHHLAADLPRRPLGRTLRVTYELCLAGQVTASHQFKEAWRYLQLSSRGELERKVGLVLEELGRLPGPGLEGHARLAATHARLGRLEEEAGSLPSPAPPLPLSGIASLDATPCASAAASPCLPLQPIKLDRFNLKQSLLALKDSQRQTARPYDALRTELLAELLLLLQQHLVPPARRALHEVTTFTSLAGVKRHLVGAPRAALHLALTRPGDYLGEALAIQDQGEIPATFPDIAIGYKLHLECPRLINMFDWLTCWNSIVTGEEEDGAEIPARQQARFARVVAELQMLGFIKTSSKKTDHVARLTFGGN